MRRATGGARRCPRAARRGRGTMTGLDGVALCHDFFGVCASEAHGEACVRFRCGPPRDAEDGTRVLQFVDHAYCHRS